MSKGITVTGTNNKPAASLPIFLRQVHWREFLACLLFIVAVLSGKVTVARLFPAIELMEFVQIRFLAFPVAVVLFWPEIIKIEWLSRKSVIPAGIGLFASYMAVRFFFDHGPDGPAKLVDLGFLFAQSALMVVAASTIWRLCYLGIAVLAVALFLVGLAVAGVGDQEMYGLSWAPIGGPITFSRIEFLAFCVVWCLFWPVKRLRIAACVLAAIFFYSTLASLLKAAIVAAFFVAFCGIVVLIVQRHWSLVIGLLASVLLGTAGWQVGFGATAGQRFAQALDITPVETAGTSDTVKALPDKPLDAETVEALPENFQGSEAGLLQAAGATPGTTAVAITYCSVSPTSGAANPGAETATKCHNLSFMDWTGRIALAAEAIRGYLPHPWFGNGVATFEFLSIDRYSRDLYRYTYPHNILLETLFSGGLVGLTIISGIFMYVIFSVIKKVIFQSGWRQYVSTILIVYLVFMAVAIMLAGDFYDSRLFWLTGIAALVLPDTPRRAVT